MRLTPLIAVGFSIGFLLALAPSCGPATATCSAANCDGCCDEVHMCHPGNEATFCGVHANACVSCGTNACNQGTCFLLQVRLLLDGGIGGGFEGPDDGGDREDGGTSTPDGGGTTDGGGTLDGGRGYGIDAFCESAQSALCAYHVRCGRAQARVSCEDVFARSAWKQVCGVDEKAAVKDGRATFDPVAAQACRVALRNSVSCALPPAPCTGVFTGNVGVAGPCFDKVDCAAGEWCDSTVPVCPGACRMLKPAGMNASSAEECQAGLYLYLGKCAEFAPAGMPCGPPTGVSGPDQQCVSGSVCNPDHRCVQLGGVGAMCASDSECHFNLQCVNRMCRPFVAMGQPCGSTTTGECRFDLRCPPATALAPSCALLGDAGVFCANTLDCSSAYFCDRPDAGGIGRCAPVGGAGAPCSGSVECGPNLFCNGGGQCAPVRQLGQACMMGACAPGLACVMGMCAYPVCHDPTP